MAGQSVFLRRLACFGVLLATGSCGYDPSTRFSPEPRPAPACSLGQLRCTTAVERCEDRAGKPLWVTLEDCAAEGQVCVPDGFECRNCQPEQRRCDGQDVVICDSKGDKETVSETCDASKAMACRAGSCQDLCAVAAERRSNVGCEYWAVDLDNARLDESRNAAAQQFAVVVSNAQPDIAAEITVERDDSLPGEDGAAKILTRTLVPPFSLTVLRLGPREVDGSEPGTYNTGTHTALSRTAYRIRSSVPVVAYQFNPLENVSVFSNDASLLKPTEALRTTPGMMRPAYVALGWPQTIASTDDPATNFNPDDPIDLRAFLTLVGTQESTTVRIEPSTRVLGGGDVPEMLPGNGYELTLNPFDVLNLETDDFGADFTGTLIESDQPVVAFSGSEASDAPHFESLAQRRCCADHLEEQLDPIRTAGRRFVATVSSNRADALSRAGAELGLAIQPDYFRIIAVTEAGARLEVRTSRGILRHELAERGSWVEIPSVSHFILDSDAPVMLGSISAGQEAANIPTLLPGGDPSFMLIPPVEQYRSSYVFLTPDKYAFDFVRIVAPPDTEIRFDGEPLETALSCEQYAADGLSAEERGQPLPSFWVYQCQLSFPIFNPALDAADSITPGRQNDGVHRLEASRPVGLMVDGFDAYVSYAYAGGTELSLIVPE